MNGIKRQGQYTAYTKATLRALSIEELQALQNSFKHQSIKASLYSKSLELSYLRIANKIMEVIKEK